MGLYKKVIFNPHIYYLFRTQWGREALVVLEY